MRAASEKERVVTHTLWTLSKLLVVLVLGLSLMHLRTDGALAQENETVAWTLQLFLTGNVPEDETFRVFLELVPQRGGDSPLPLYLCGELAGERCVGRSTPYAESLTKVPRGSIVRYEFGRFGQGGKIVQSFSTDTITINDDTVTTAHYSFPVPDNQQDMPSDLPDTGAGGLAGGGLPLSGIAAVVSLLAVGYVALRRR